MKFCDKTFALFGVWHHKTTKTNKQSVCSQIGYKKAMNSSWNTNGYCQEGGKSFTTRWQVLRTVTITVIDITVMQSTVPFTLPITDI